ncbi:MAG: hypothetical protein EA390_01080 [Balneolaceae bacterium]|nr:MAG: hypothetical protein EA390_01080 [Balneolaceae bacterium]
MFTKNIELEPGEEILIRSRHHNGYMMAGLAMILYGIAMMFITGFNPDLLLIGIGVLLLLFGFIKWSYLEYVVTNRRFIRVSGYFYIQIEQYLLEKVGHVTLWQNSLDRFWDRGVITLHGIGIRTKKIRGLKNATSFKNAIHSQLSVEPDHYFD